MTKGHVDGRDKPAMTANESSGLSPLSSRDHLLEDLPADVLVGEAGLVPPPAIPLHLLGSGDEAAGDLGEIRIAVVQAEDQAASADPAQREPLGPQIILQHPIVA